MSAIVSEHISKKFKDTTALNDISFQIGRNELFGFIGPDGAGKTTLFRLIASLMLPDTGSLKVLGLDPVKEFKELRKKLGYMPGRFSLYQDLTVEENLDFYATIFGTNIQENYSLISDIYSHIEPFKDRPAGKLSGGMKQKLALSCALIHKPDLLILDEPTTGVDAVSRKEFWQMLKKLQTQGITIVVSTPYMDEAALCDRVALIQKGSLLSVDSPENIIKSFQLELFGLRAPDMYQLLLALQAYPNCNTAHLFGQYIHASFHGSLNKEDLKAYLSKKAINEAEIIHVTPGIEDCFMELMSANEKVS
ncbi:MAG TPA: ABC transporter ATP-binding protein [Bacteroidales bacterium]|nr:ABC transporter ATP-binding protein [Bacteroidales bacterium]